MSRFSLPLRLVLMASMAPALTEASTETGVKLCATSPSAADDTVNGNYCTLVNSEQHTNGDVPEGHIPDLNDEHRSQTIANIKIRNKQLEQELGNGKHLYIQKHRKEVTSCDPKTTRISEYTGFIDKDHISVLDTQGLDKTIAKKSILPMDKYSIVTTKAPSPVSRKLTSVHEQDLIIPGSNESHQHSMDNIPIHRVDSISDSDIKPTNATSSMSHDQTRERKRTLILDCAMEASRKQHSLERRAERLLQRLRKLQSVNACTHVHHQLSGFVDHQRRNLQSMAKSMKPSVDYKPDSLFQTEDLKNLSTSALVTLVRQLQYSQVTLRQRLSTTTVGNDSNSVLTLDENLCSELDKVSGTMNRNLNHLLGDIDSDVTEESSGGESADEEEGVTYIPFGRRADWRWTMERGAVASRWTWLQAQVSDLEYKIRQQTDISRQIRAAKGSVVLGKAISPEELKHQTHHVGKTGRKLSPIEQKIANIEKRNDMSPCSISTVLSNVDKQSTRLTQSLGNCYSPLGSPQMTKKQTKTINGLIDTSHDSEVDIMDVGEGTASQSSQLSGGGFVAGLASPGLDTSCQAARTRPVKEYRKRKLLRTSGMYYWNRKFIRLSTVSCYCTPPSSCCALCGGRYNNVQSVDPYSQSYAERVTLLDHSYHSVLSFKQEVPLTVHFEKLLKTGEWQHNAPTKNVKNTAKRKHKSESDSTRKAVKKLGKREKKFILSTPKPRKGLSKSYNGSSAPKNSDGRLYKTGIKKRKAKQIALAAIKKHQRSLSSPGQSSSSTALIDHHLGHSMPANMYRDLKRRVTAQSAFDIDNIVIPYSMAASTRVVKLNYKEIVTPRWRDVSDNSRLLEDTPSLVVEEKLDEKDPKQETLKNGVILTKEFTDEEDISDDTYLVRHMRSEVLEKKRFVAFMQINKRPSHRTSRESGSLTPDLSGKTDKKLVQDNATATPDSGTATPEGLSGTTGIISAAISDTYLNQVESSRGTPNPWSPESSLTDSLFNSTDLTSPLFKEPNTASTTNNLQTVPGARASSNTIQCRVLSEDSTTSVTPSKFTLGKTTAPVNPGAPSIMEYIKSDVPTWQSRTFPLADPEYEELFKEPRPVTPVLCPAVAASAESEPSSPLAGNLSPRAPSSGSSVVGEDPNDPEWTVVSDEKEIHEKIVLRLAKK